MSGDVQVRFCERLGVKVPRPTRLCDTVDGAHASSLLYGLVITAKLNAKDPFQVMTQIFSRIPDANTADEYAELAKLLLSPENPQSCIKKEG